MFDRVPYFTLLNCLPCNWQVRYLLLAPTEIPSTAHGLCTKGNWILKQTNGALKPYKCLTSTGNIACLNIQYMHTCNAWFCVRLSGVFFKRRYFKYVLITHKGSKFALGGRGKVIWPEVYNKYCISIIIRCPFQAFTHRIKVSIVIPQNRKKAPRSLRSKSYALFYHRSKRLRIVVRFALRFVPLSAYWWSKSRA